ncbi:phage portal protein [Agromyces archimandritae]|uniref:Phage portal protein n=1 Tax=Agromyces archimandritae TaxID=2781962 RepID=A0A975FMC8_9MICO|nr:phage portal protein [Agromyces archimandritae]QTX04542.1 phage portal protein [Agromyces archimandritae]
MPLTPALVDDAVAALDRDLRRDGRLGKVKRYLAGDHDRPFLPGDTTRALLQLADRSQCNWLPLVSDTFSRSLAVDGFRAARAADDALAWAHWQANGLDARQTIAHRGALEYGTSYVVVWPDASLPTGARIRPLSPLRSAAWYANPDADFPSTPSSSPA